MDLPLIFSKSLELPNFFMVYVKHVFEKIHLFIFPSGKRGNPYTFFSHALTRQPANC